MFKRFICVCCVAALLPFAQIHAAQEVQPLPLPGVMVALSPAFEPPILKGIKVHPDNPFTFDFILDKGDLQEPQKSESQSPAQAGPQGQSTQTSTPVSESPQPQQQVDVETIDLNAETQKLIKYFLASFTVPEQDLWVNLSPYEKDRVVPEAFGKTQMGRDLLAQDYLLKQVTSSLLYPDGPAGKQFWKKVYSKAAKEFGLKNSVNTYNKVWIVPDRAVVYENTKAGTVYIVSATLKVLLEEDYLASTKNSPALTEKHAVSKKVKTILRDVIIPELTLEVNKGKNFAQLRQIYNSLILAAWYKQKIKDSLLTQVYADRNKIKGTEYSQSILQTQPAAQQALVFSKGKVIELSGALPRKQLNDVELIYARYLEAFKKGAYNFIKEEPDPITQRPVPRKYFSGGAQLNHVFITRTSVVPPSFDEAMLSVQVDLSRDTNKKIYVHPNVARSLGIMTPKRRVNRKVGSLDSGFDLKIHNSDDAMSTISKKVKHANVSPDVDNVLRGGIDMRRDGMGLKVVVDAQLHRKDIPIDAGIHFRLDKAMLERFKDTDGFVPVIMNVTPITNLKAWLT